MGGYCRKCGETGGCDCNKSPNETRTPSTDALAYARSLAFAGDFSADDMGGDIGTCSLRNPDGPALFAIIEAQSATIVGLREALVAVRPFVVDDFDEPVLPTARIDTALATDEIDALPPDAIEARIRVVAYKTALNRGGQTEPVCDYDLDRARAHITGENADRLRLEGIIEAQSATIARMREAGRKLLDASERHIFGDECMAERHAMRAALATKER